MSIFRLYPGLKLSFEHNSVRKNLFLSACFCWDSRLSLRDMDQKFKFGGTIGYEDSYLEFLFRHFKILDYTLGQGVYIFEESPKSVQDVIGDVYCPGKYCSNREK